MRRRWWLIGVVLAVPVAWYLGSPLFVNRSVNEQFPMSRGATVPPGMTRQQVEDRMAAAAKIQTPAAEPMPAAGAPVALALGHFVAIDQIHRAEGTATIYRTGDGRILRLDPFKSANGPDLYVYLSGHPAPRTNAQLREAGVLELAHLKGNIGSQNYDLPAGLDVSKYKSVVIYCRPFHVVFSTATLAPK